MHYYYFVCACVKLRNTHYYLVCMVFGVGNFDAGKKQFYFLSTIHTIICNFISIIFTEIKLTIAA